MKAREAATATVTAKGRAGAPSWAAVARATGTTIKAAAALDID